LPFWYRNDLHCCSFPLFDFLTEKSTHDHAGWLCVNSLSDCASTLKNREVIHTRFWPGATTAPSPLSGPQYDACTSYPHLRAQKFLDTKARAMVTTHGPKHRNPLASTLRTTVFQINALGGPSEIAYTNPESIQGGTLDDSVRIHP
jgi:hypothetical protein